MITALIMAAAAVSSPMWTEKDKEICQQIEHFSGKIMEARQAGVSISDLLETTETVDDPSYQPMMDILKVIIIQAYNSPRFSTPEYQYEAAIDFKNEWATACYEQRAKK